MKTIKKWIASRIQSKKFTVWLSAIIVTLTMKYIGIELSPDTIAQAITWITVTYLGAQGIADAGSKGATSGLTEGPQSVPKEIIEK